MTSVDTSKLFARIDKLYDVGPIGKLSVLVVGCGSGGGAVAQQLVMSGCQSLVLVDKDILEVENVIRHVCGLSFVGRRKVDALSQLLKDRNPRVTVVTSQMDVLEGGAIVQLIAAADIVVLATDNDPTRWLINDLCVKQRKPFCVARVFTRGIGGEVFAYRPLEGGCLGCLEKVLQRTEFRSGIHEIDLISDHERDEMYGLGITEIKESPGLNVDISFITSLHTRFVLDSMARLLPERPKYLKAIDENYVVWGNRPEPPFERHFQIQRIKLAPQDGCLICGVPRDE